MSNFVGCFLTGTAAEVTPISQIDKFNFEVCDLIKNLSKDYQNLVRKKVAAQFFCASISMDQAKNLKIGILNNILSILIKKVNNFEFFGDL